MGSANLTLELTTAGGGDLNDFVRIELFGIDNSNHYQSNVQVSRKVTVKEIQAAGSSLYRVMVTPSNYRIVQCFVMLIDGGTQSQTLVCPVDPSRVTGIAAPAFAGLPDKLQAVLTRSDIPRFTGLSGEALYEALAANPKLQACLLNIGAKSRDTLLRDGGSCLDHFAGIVRIEPDRFFVSVDAALREEVQNSPLFHSVSAALHEPLPGYTMVDSYKTLDRYGNLQLTFQRSGQDYLADVDIDDAQGVEHVFQVIRNTVTLTNPYDIHDILIQDQHLDPGYTFVFAQAAAVAS